MVVTIRLLREYWMRYLRVMADAFPMVIFIVIYISYYSWIGYIIFSGTIEGVVYFDTYPDSWFNMLVLMTTSNFPNVMLPAYQLNRLYGIYFMSYLIIGLFLLMNLLLGVIYSNFKTRFEDAEDLNEERREYLYDQLIHMGGGKGYLRPNETYKMFMMIHGLATNSDQTISDEELIDQSRKSSIMNASLIGMPEAKRSNDSASSFSNTQKKHKKRDITMKQFEYIY